MLVPDSAVKQEAVELLKTLVSIRSVNPPGGEDEIVSVVKKLLAEDEIESTIVPLEEGRSSLVARVRGRASGRRQGSIVLCGHLDTVNADEEKWTLPPFSPRMDGDRVWGLGSADMKGGVAVIMALLMQIVRSGQPPKQDIVLALTADEEYAYRGAASIARSGLIDDAEFLLITEPTGGKAYCGQKGELWVEATFSGKAAHGSMPEQGINSIIPASEFCTDLAEAAQRFEETPGRGRTSLNIGQIDGGWQVNIVPDTTRVRIDSRVTSDEDKSMVLDLIERLGENAASHVGARFAYRVYNYKPPIISDVDNPHLKRFRAAVAGDGRPVPVVEIAPYSTDAVAIVPEIDVPVVIYGPGDIAQAHQPDEFIELESLYDSLAVIARFLNMSERDDDMSAKRD